MTLESLHRSLSKDRSYASRYAELSGIAELVIHCQAARETQGESQAELAKASGVGIARLRAFERMERVEAWVVGNIVAHLEVALKKRGVDTTPWIGAQEPTWYDDLDTVRGLSARPMPQPKKQKA